MGLKILKAIWFLSVIVVVIDVLYVYASLPEHVVNSAGSNRNDRH